MKNDSGGTRCKSKNLSGEQVEDIVIDKLKKINKDVLMQEYQALKDTLSNNDNSAEVENINKKISNTELCISNLVKQLSMNTDSTASTYIISEIEKLNSEISKSKEQLIEINQDKKGLDDDFFDIDMILKALTRFNDEIDNAATEDKRFLISMLLDKITWDFETGYIQLIYWGVDRVARK